MIPIALSGFLSFQSLSLSQVGLNHIMDRLRRRHTARSRLATWVPWRTISSLLKLGNDLMETLLGRVIIAAHCFAKRLAFKAPSQDVPLATFPNMYFAPTTVWERVATEKLGPHHPAGIRIVFAHFGTGV